MDLIRTIKQTLYAQLAPLAAHAADRGISGDRLQWSMLGIAAAIGGLILAAPAVLPGWQGVLLLLPAALGIRAVALSVAELLTREHPELKARDPVVREVTDAGSDLLLYLPLAVYPGVAPTPVVLLVVLGLLTEIAGLARLARGGERRRDGPMGLQDRAIIFAMAALILALDPRAAPWLPWLLLPAAGLAVVTLAKRIRREQAATG